MQGDRDAGGAVVTPTDDRPDISVVVLAYGPEPLLERCVRSLLDSEGVAAEVILVDNGATGGSVGRLEQVGLERLRVIRPRVNLGYAAGCNEGVRHARADTLAFVNSDAIVGESTLARLREVCCREGVGIATGSIRLLDRPNVLNSAGNDIHFTGLSWSGHFGEDVQEHTEEVLVTGASGAGMALTRESWDLLGGFDETLFMYHDDTELSLRCHLLGLGIVFVPDAVVLHDYEFGRNPRKLYLIERNRLMMVITSYKLRTLALLAPAIAMVEVASLALALREGWWRSKVRAWWWLLSHGSLLRRRRRHIQALRRDPDRNLVPLFVDVIDPGNYDLSSAARLLNLVLRAYWRAASRLI